MEIKTINVLAMPDFILIHDLMNYLTYLQVFYLLASLPDIFTELDKESSNCLSQVSVFSLCVQWVDLTSYVYTLYKKKKKKKKKKLFVADKYGC